MFRSPRSRPSAAELPGGVERSGSGQSCPAAVMGGQAVIDGIIMRNGSVYALAMRRPDGGIAVERRSWRSLPGGKGRPFLRGFPILAETLLNGVKALNRSADLSASPRDKEKMPHGVPLVLTLLAAVALALGLFVVLPHFLSLGMKILDLGGGMEGLSFHLWDGLFKFAIFLLYAAAISLMPDIRAIFQYHGAEHKVIGAYEAGGEVSARSAARYSRLHPRCGTAFLLFVLILAILLHSLLVPFFLHLWEPRHAALAHAAVLGFKALLIIPVSALGYEFVHYAARPEPSLAGRFLLAPGLFLQLLTTREPDHAQLEVAVAALREALGDAAPARILAPPYAVLE